MPVIDDDPQAPPQPAPATVRVAAPEFRSVTVDTRYEPVASLLTNVQGSSWIANYFSQILAGDSQLSGQQQSLDPLYQQYRLIRDFELKVTTPLVSAQDDQTKSMKLTGAANVYPFLIPNIGDMFVADMGDGRAGIFKVTGSERRSIFKDTTYAIEYELVAFEGPDRSADLYSKVQQTLVFVKDFLMHGQNPMLELSDFEKVRVLAERYAELCELYFSGYNSREYRTLLVPQQEYPTYDHFLTKTVTKFVSTWDAQGVRNVRVLNLDDDQAMASLTLWDALAQQSPRLLKRAAKHMKIVSAKLFTRDPMMEGIYWSGIQQVLYPADQTVTVDFDPLKPTKIDLDKELREVDEPDPVLVNPLPAVRSLQDLISDRILDDDLPYGDAPMIKPVLADDFYIFSQQFYEQTPLQQSKLELAVWDYLQRKPVSYSLLLALCDTFHSWGTLERYYYLPIVLVLIKANIRYL